MGAEIRSPTLAAASSHLHCLGDRIDISGKMGVKPQTGVNLTMPFFLLVEDFRVCQEESRHNGIILVAGSREGLAVRHPPPPPTRGNLAGDTGVPTLAVRLALKCLRPQRCS